jgi:hypothetical protein
VAELGAFDDAVIRLKARFPRSPRDAASAGPAGAGRGRGMGRGSGTWRSGAGERRADGGERRRADAYKDRGYNGQRREAWTDRDAAAGKGDVSGGSTVRVPAGVGTRHSETGKGLGAEGAHDAPVEDAWDGQAGMEEVEDLVGPDGLLYA